MPMPRRCGGARSPPRRRNEPLPCPAGETRDDVEQGRLAGAGRPGSVMNSPGATSSETSSRTTIGPYLFVAARTVIARGCSACRTGLWLHQWGKLVRSKQADCGLVPLPHARGASPWPGPPPAWHLRDRAATSRHPPGSHSEPAARAYWDEWITFAAAWSSGRTPCPRRRWRTIPRRASPAA